jgi:hypothetical protein
MAEGRDGTPFAELTAPKTLALPAPAAAADEQPVAPTDEDRLEEIRAGREAVAARVPRRAPGTPDSNRTGSISRRI